MVSRWQKVYHPVTNEYLGVVWYEDGWWFAETPTASTCRGFETAEEASTMLEGRVEWEPGIARSIRVKEAS